MAVLDQMREHHPKIPVIMMSSLPNGGRLERALRAGARDYIMKPFDYESLFEKCLRHFPTPSDRPGDLQKKPETKTRKVALPKQPIAETTMTAKDATIQGGAAAFLSEDELRGRVAAKAYELYAQRQAVTEADDWLNAERLVKEQLLAQGDHAGLV